MARFDIPATARASFAFYNTRDEIDALVGGTATTCTRYSHERGSQDLYQEVILDHNKRPRNFREHRRMAARPKATTRCAAIG